jgi:peptidoglycan/xylan/chitin deacetylase (PgdA/CDA1 family)
MFLVAEEPISVRRLPLILMYHSVGTVGRDPHRLCVSPDRFARQMDWLAQRGLRGVSIAALLNAHATGATDHLVGITFDDGYADVIKHALPVLGRHRFTATMFVLPGRLDGINDWDDALPWPLLSASGIRELAAAEMEIGSHTATHARLAGASPAELSQIADSRAALEDLTGQPVGGFAYPYGSVDQQARLAVRMAGYGYACAVSPQGIPGRFALPRIGIGQADGPIRMAAMRAIYRPWFSAGYHRQKGYRNLWGIFAPS